MLDNFQITLLTFLIILAAINISIVIDFVAKWFYKRKEK